MRQPMFLEFKAETGNPSGAINNGPHGIPPIAHAKPGGKQPEAVLAYLEEGRNDSPPTWKVLLKRTFQVYKTQH